jgi:hypothetical protein
MAAPGRAPRDRLPEPEQRPNFGFSGLFQLVKGVVGTDVSLQKDMSLPVALCEPLTDLQRRGEFMSYSELLDQARAAARPARAARRAGAVPAGP